MSERREIAIFGAGGFSRETASILSGSNCEDDQLVAFVDDFSTLDELEGLPVMTLERFQTEHPDARVVLAVGDGATRERIVQRIDEHGVRYVSVVHRSVMMSGRVSVGNGTILCPGSFLTTDITIGEHVHVNLCCTIGHDVTIDEFASIAPGVNISGNVHIGRCSWIGTGASIIQGKTNEPLVIGEGSIIAAGACVTTHVEPRSLYAGVPARLKKQL